MKNIEYILINVFTNFIAMVVVAFLIAIPFQLVYNSCIPSMFGLNSITLFESFAFNLLYNMFFFYKIIKGSETPEEQEEQEEEEN